MKCDQKPGFNYSELTFVAIFKIELSAMKGTTGWGAISSITVARDCLHCGFALLSKYLAQQE
jgi:hypothetical protein